MSRPVALITGASRGLGAALGAELAGQGWDLIVDARGAEALTKTVETWGEKVVAIPGDVAAPDHREELARAVHRLGRLLIGETSVAVIVTAPHRRPAFEAALEGIDRLKKIVPIWKKEHFVDGEVWVEGEWDRHVPVVG